MPVTLHNLIFKDKHFSCYLTLEYICTRVNICITNTTVVVINKNGISNNNGIIVELIITHL